MSDEQAVLYEVTDEAVGVVTLNRPDKANSQTPAMLDELNDVLMGAAADRAVKVIVLQANGKHFSAGHDIGTPGRDVDQTFDRTAVIHWDHVGKQGVELAVMAEDDVAAEVPGEALRVDERGRLAARVAVALEQLPVGESEPLELSRAPEAARACADDRDAVRPARSHEDAAAGAASSTEPGCSRC